jgi:hypothetical protein
MGSNPIRVLGWLWPSEAWWQPPYRRILLVFLVCNFVILFYYIIILLSYYFICSWSVNHVSTTLFGHLAGNRWVPNTARPACAPGSTRPSPQTPTTYITHHSQPHSKNDSAIIPFVWLFRLWLKQYKLYTSLRYFISTFFCVVEDGKGKSRWGWALALSLLWVGLWLSHFVGIGSYLWR